MASKRRSTINSIPSVNCYMDYDYELYTQEGNLSFCQRYRRCFIALTILLLLLVLVFIVIFVVPPITFMFSINVQRYFIFLTSYGNESKGFTNFKQYGIQGVRNLYVPVRPNITLGVWHILPLSYVCKTTTNKNYNYEDALKMNDYPVLLYFHDSGENRITSVNKYEILRQFFHVITFDYRSFGDSSVGELLEDELMYDSFYLYKWLVSQNTNVYVWGHGLGSAIATKMITYQGNEPNSSAIVRKMPPKGLFLESAFTNLEDVFTLSPYLKIFSWTPWFEPTIINPLIKNFKFATDKYIGNVPCPIMIMHAEDNKLVPYILAEKLLKVTQRERRKNAKDNLDSRCSILLHLYPKKFQYGHNNIYLDPEFPDYIKDHLTKCNKI